MPDLLVTTPKSRMAEAAQEAEDAKQYGGDTLYFRFFGQHSAPKNVKPGDRIYYVEDGFVRGFAVVESWAWKTGQDCDTTGRRYTTGFYAFMRADSWQWIKPVAMTGFQGWRYAAYHLHDSRVEIVGGWLDQKPEVQDASR